MLNLSRSVCRPYLFAIINIISFGEVICHQIYMSSCCHGYEGERCNTIVQRNGNAVGERWCMYEWMITKGESCSCAIGLCATEYVDERTTHAKWAVAWSECACNNFTVHTNGYAICVCVCLKNESEKLRMRRHSTADRESDITQIKIQLILNIEFTNLLQIPSVLLVNYNT